MNIPHSLAAIAAVICLGLAFATDFQAREDGIRGQMASPGQLEPPLPAQDEPLRERAVNDTAGKVKRERSPSRLGPALLPWFPGHRNGH